MLRQFIIIVSTLLMLGNFSLLFSTNHYINKSASGNNAGTSWENGWISFASINWDVILPGDTVYISGGSDLTVYNEMLDIIVSGTVNNPIVFTSGKDQNHSGRVIIDGEEQTVHCINIDAQQYVVVSGLELRSSDQSVVDIEDSRNVTIENCKIHTSVRAGVNLFDNRYVTISGCEITTGTMIDHQTDGIYSQGNYKNIYSGNRIIIRNNDPNGHDDCIQMYKDTSIVVHSNYIEQDNIKTSNAQGIYNTTGAGTNLFYNNVVYMPNSEDAAIGFRNLSTGTGTIEIYNNTIYGIREFSLIYVDGATPTIKNNILCSDDDAFIVRLYEQQSDPDKYDYNLYFSPNTNTPIYYYGDGRSWNEWQNLNFDLHGVYADPMFNNIAEKDFTLKPNSPAIDAGIDLSTIFQKDISGLPRPQGSSWDIGAFETQSVSAIDDDKLLPNTIQLYQNYPNPFNPSTTIEFRLSKTSYVSLKIFNSLGEQVAELVNGIVSAGTHSISYNSSNLASGIYFYRLESSSFVETKKMVLLR